MRYIIDNRSSLTGNLAIEFVHEYADYLVETGIMRATVEATHGRKRHRIVFRRNRVVPSFTVYDVEG